MCLNVCTMEGKDFHGKGSNLSNDYLTMIKSITLDCMSDMGVLSQVCFRYTQNFHKSFHCRRKEQFKDHISTTPPISSNSSPSVQHNHLPCCKLQVNLAKKKWQSGKQKRPYLACPAQQFLVMFWAESPQMNNSPLFNR